MRRRRCEHIDAATAPTLIVKEMEAALSGSSNDKFMRVAADDYGLTQQDM